MAPGLVPSPRLLGGRRLQLASLTGSERRGDFVQEAQPRAVAPSSRQTSSPARIPDWEREEGRLRPWCPALCRRLVAITRSFYQMLLVEEIAVYFLTTHSVTGPAPRASMMENPANAISVVSSYGWFIMFLCVFLSTTVCQYATYPLYYFGYPSCRSSC